MNPVLSAAQIEEFYSHGFFVAPNVFGPVEIERMRESFARLEDESRRIKTTQLHLGSQFVLGEKKGNTVIHRIVWCGAAEPYLLQIAADPRLVNRAAQLLGSHRMQQLINQAHFKMPGDGVAFPWHQDIQHRQKGEHDWTDVNGRGSYVQTILALDDMNEQNGPVMFIPKSHLGGRLDLGGDGYDTPTREESFDAKTAVPAIAPAGSVIFFGPYTVHGSFPNHSTVARRVFINGYAFPGANSRVYPGQGSGRWLEAAPTLELPPLPPRKGA